MLAMFLLGDEFSTEQKRRNFDYYDRLTTGDSSLSACVQSIVAAEVGDERRRRCSTSATHCSWTSRTSPATPPTACTSRRPPASGHALVFGFGGVRDFDGVRPSSPACRAAWRSLSFSLRFRDRQVRVKVTHDEETYLVEEDGARLRSPFEASDIC